MTLTLILMPVNKDALLRYRVIDELLRTNKRPVSIEEMIGRIASRSDKQVSARTVKADLKELKENPDYNAPIVNSRGQGYKYSDSTYRLFQLKLNTEEQQVVVNALNLLNQIKGMPLSDELKAAVIKLQVALPEGLDSATVVLDQFETFSGARHLKQIYDAICNKNSIVFRYRKFGDQTHLLEDLTVSPLLLKEYNRRWYVLVYDSEEENYRTYGLDRIETLRVSTDLPYCMPANFNGNAYYQHAFGVTVIEDQEPQWVKLKVRKPLLYYIQEASWHASQQLSMISNEEANVMMYVYVGSELLKEVLS